MKQHPQNPRYGLCNYRIDRVGVFRQGQEGTVPEQPRMGRSQHAQGQAEPDWGHATSTRPPWRPVPKRLGPSMFLCGPGPVGVWTGGLGLAWGCLPVRTAHRAGQRTRPITPREYVWLTKENIVFRDLL